MHILHSVYTHSCLHFKILLYIYFQETKINLRLLLHSRAYKNKNYKLSVYIYIYRIQILKLLVLVQLNRYIYIYVIKIKYNKFVTKQKIKKLYVLILHYEWVTYTPGADPGFFPRGGKLA